MEERVGRVQCECECSSRERHRGKEGHGLALFVVFDVLHSRDAQ